MNCEECQSLISTFLDCELDETGAANVRTHLAICVECAKICEDFSMILDVCELEEIGNSLPPNPQALWCRINNIIESEATEISRQAEQKQTEKRRRGWQFSIPQMASMILGIALLSSLITVLGIKSYSPSKDDLTATASDTIFDKILSKIGLVETQQEIRERRIKEQETAIAYWNSRVEEKRTKWDAHLREAFDRNLNEINQVVVDYDRILRDNPQDEISGEMLDSAMNEKMELLREFSEL